MKKQSGAYPRRKNVCERLSTLCGGSQELAEFILEMVADD